MSWLLYAGALGLALLLVLGVLVATTDVLPLPGVPLSGNTVEYGGGGVVVVEQNLTPEPGAIYKLSQTPQGLMFLEQNQKLVEELKLTNITLSNGDAIAPHLFDWYFDGVDDYVQFDYSALYSSYAVTAQASMVRAKAEIPENTSSWTKIAFLPPTVSRFEWHPSGGVYYLWYGVVNSSTGSYVPLTASLAELKTNVWGTIAYSLYDNGGYWHKVEFQDGVVLQDVTTIYTTTNYDSVYYITNTVYLKLTIPYNYTLIQGKLSYILIYNNATITSSDLLTIYNKTLPNYNGAVRHLVDATFFDGTSYYDITAGVAGAPYGASRVPAEEMWLWFIEALHNDNLVHFRFFPQGTVIEITDTVTGQKWTYVLDGVANAAGLIDDYAIEPPTANPVDLVAYVPSERVRFYAPPGFTLQINNTTSSTEVAVPSEGVVTPAQSGSVRLLAERDEQVYITVEETPAVYRVRIEAGGFPAAGAYVWIINPEDGSVIRYGTADATGAFELPKGPNTPGKIRVKAVYLDSGVYYNGERDFALGELEQAKGLLAAGGAFTAAAAAVLLLFAIAGIVVVLGGMR